MSNFTLSLKTFFRNAWKKSAKFFRKLFVDLGNAIVRPTVKQKLKYFDVLRTVIAVAISLLLTLVILLFVSDKPFAAFSDLLFGPLTDGFWFAEVLRNSVPLIFAGVAAAIMLKCGQFNMIGEGSFYIGGLCGAIVAIYFDLPPFLAVACSLVISMLVTALIGAVPAVLKAKLGVNEFVSSLMFNFIMLWVGLYFLQTFFKDPNIGDVATSVIPEQSRFGILIPNTYLTTNIFVAVIVVVLAGIFIYKTRYGYAIRLTGDNANFAKYCGIGTGSAIIYSQIIGSGIAGLGGAVEILGGMSGRFNWKALPGYGFDGFLVSILAKNNPILVPFAAFFISYLRTGANLMSLRSDVAVELVSIIQAVIIIIVAGQAFLANYRQKIFKPGKKSHKEEKSI